MLRCAPPPSAQVDRLLVRFSRRRDAAAAVVAGAGKTQGNLRRGAAGRRAAGRGAARRGDLGDSAPPAAEQAFEIRAIRETKLAGPQPVSLASLPEADPQQATLVVRSLGPKPLADHQPPPQGRRYRAGAGRPMPDRPCRLPVRSGCATLGGARGGRGALDLGETAPLPGAWVWSGDLRSQYAAGRDGAAPRRLSLAERGEAGVRFRLPAGTPGKTCTGLGSMAAGSARGVPPARIPPRWPSSFRPGEQQSHRDGGISARGPARCGRRGGSSRRCRRPTCRCLASTGACACRRATRCATTLPIARRRRCGRSPGARDCSDRWAGRRAGPPSTRCGAADWCVRRHWLTRMSPRRTGRRPGWTALPPGGCRSAAVAALVVYPRADGPPGRLGRVLLAAAGTWGLRGGRFRGRARPGCWGSLPCWSRPRGPACRGRVWAACCFCLGLALLRRWRSWAAVAFRPPGTDAKRWSAWPAKMDRPARRGGGRPAEHRDGEIAVGGAVLAAIWLRRPPRRWPREPEKSPPPPTRCSSPSTRNSGRPAASTYVPEPFYDQLYRRAAARRRSRKAG